MELSEFIRDTLIAIKDGIHDSNVEINTRDGKEMGKDGRMYFGMEAYNRDKKEGFIVFDIAVTVNSETKRGAGGGIQIAVLNLGGEVSETGTNQNISRIKFHIMPTTYIG